MEIKLIPGTCQCCRYFGVDVEGRSGWQTEGENRNNGSCSEADRMVKHFVVPGALQGVGLSEDKQCPLWQMIRLKFCILDGHGWYPERDGCIHCQEEGQGEQSRGKEYNPLPS